VAACPLVVRAFACEDPRRHNHAEECRDDDEAADATKVYQLTVSNLRYRQKHNPSAYSDSLAIPNLWFTIPIHQVKKVNFSLCLTNYITHHEDVWRSGCIDPRIIDFGTSWR
jgi:hypothetical protein